MNRELSVLHPYLSVTESLCFAEAAWGDGTQWARLQGKGPDWTSAKPNRNTRIRLVRQVGGVTHQ